MPKFLQACILLLLSLNVSSQVVITPAGSAQALAQKLVGEGVTISNVTFTGDAQMLMAGHFKNTGGTNINIDSGIVLTTGRAKTSGTNKGVDAAASNTASSGWSLPGDITLANAIGAPLSDMEDACILEFDFVPLGDTVRFNYVFSSEEYTASFVCDFNDAFGFFISGPGITGQQNIALVPNTSMPVSIMNVNNVDPWNPNLCQTNTAYYVDNSTNGFFSHDGHTTVLTAVSRVTPCETYHLKLVISDNVDDVWDSGVFLEAKSLTSNVVELINNMQTTTGGTDYLVEGCVPGSFTIRRPRPDPNALTVTLQYGGTAINGTDVQPMPTTITIPAFQTEVIVPIMPVIDGLPEGIETVKVYSLAGCAAVIPIDSTVFEIRDYDTLGILPNNDTNVICRNESIQLQATGSYTTYSWTPAGEISNPDIFNPVATPTADFVTIIATANIGTCNARDSISFQWKVPELISTVNVNCPGANTGQIVVGGGPEWISPLEYSLDGTTWQSSGTFSSLPVGTYWVKVRDASGCVDSVQADLVQAFPDLVIDNTVTEPGSCLGGQNGSITVNLIGGNPAYQYSLDGTSWQNGSTLTAAPGTHTIFVQDANGCTASLSGIVVDFVNTVELETGDDPVICESLSTPLPVVSNAQSFSWTSSPSLSALNVISPIANPVVTTTYYVTATTGICDRMDSVTVFVNPAPRPNAGPDSTICFGGSIRLQGSGGVEYHWSPDRYLSSPDVRDPMVTQPLTIDYYLHVTDLNGCNSLVQDTVRVIVSPPAELFVGNDTIVAMNQPVQLYSVDVNNTGFINYEWEPSTGLSNPYIPNPVAVLDAEYTQFIVTAANASNCAGVDTLVIKTYKGPELYVPTAFTPNGDGNNDFLRVISIGMKEFRYFSVYNRYGQLVFTTKDARQGWDGRVKGVAQNTGTFVWMAEAVDFRNNVVQRKGTTTIIR